MPLRAESISHVDSRNSAWKSPQIERKDSRAFYRGAVTVLRTTHTKEKTSSALNEPRETNCLCTAASACMTPCLSAAGIIFAKKMQTFRSRSNQEMSCMLPEKCEIISEMTKSCMEAATF